ncbi:MAG: hypothetical protein A2X86_03750 [Bdellovibrionales bacterium GWA2_49_15]|nr:MAG: hypothetical protein A2X86_03750 [Bdellovibrionales bacterium GWA2_49_15]HAZ12331.1 hypothetical protein [Bdellovibrionales bacterium]
MKIANVQYIWFLLAIPFLIAFYVWAFKRKAALIEKFVSAELKERLLANFLPQRQKLKAVVLILSFTCAVLALIGPRWGFHWEEVKRRGVDIIIALDVSKSMMAEDISPNRLERAKRKIGDFLNMLQGDRVGLIAFAGTSFLQSPLTLDYGAIKLFLDELDTNLIPVPGTALGDAISKAMASFDQNDKKSRVLVLITDGEDHVGNPLEAAKKAGEQQIKIYTIGIGKDEGAPIPDKENGGFKKDSSGNLILTKLDEQTLQKIALETGGSYVRSVSGDLDLENVYKDITLKVEDKDLKSGKRQRFEERFQWFVLLALLLLIIELFISEKKTGVLLILLLSFNSFAASPRDGESAYQDKKYPEALKSFLDAQISDPKNATLKFNLGNTYYKNNDYEKALGLYESTSTLGDKDMEERSLYNLGNTAYRMGKLPEAIEYYKKALALDPNDQDAKYNLEFVREELKRRMEENKKQQEQQQQNKQQNKEQNQDQDKNKDKDKDKDKNQEQAKDQEKKKEEEKQKEQQQAKPSEEQRKEEEKSQSAKASHKKESGKMTKEEAMRWLQGLDENRKKHLKDKLEQAGGQYQIEKDW